MRTDNLIPAPVDDKNVSTDWMEEIFDDCAGVLLNHTYVGVIAERLVTARWDGNTITWQVIPDNFRDLSTAYSQLYDRLTKRNEEDERLLVKHDVSCHPLKIIQRFYWKEEE